MSPPSRDMALEPFRGPCLCARGRRVQQGHCRISHPANGPKGEQPSLALVPDRLLRAHWHIAVPCGSLCIGDPKACSRRGVGKYPEGHCTQQGVVHRWLSVARYDATTGWGRDSHVAVSLNPDLSCVPVFYVFSGHGRPMAFLKHSFTH